MVLGDRSEPTKVFYKRPEAGHQFLPWRKIFFPPHPGTGPVLQPAAITFHQGRQDGSSAVYLRGFRRCSLLRHGTHHDSKPLPPLPGFVYQHARFSPDKNSIEITVRPRQGAAAICSRCHQPAPGYDQLAERRFEFIPLWGFFVLLLYTMRRVDYRRCQAVVVEEVRWGNGAAGGSLGDGPAGPLGFSPGIPSPRLRGTRRPRYLDECRALRPDHRPQKPTNAAPELAPLVRALLAVGIRLRLFPDAGVTLLQRPACFPDGEAAAPDGPRCQR
jgi:hypothetical protein